MDIITSRQPSQYYIHKSRVVTDKFDKHVKERGICAAKKWLKQRLVKERARTATLALESISKKYPEIEL